MTIRASTILSSAFVALSMSMACGGAEGPQSTEFVAEEDGIVGGANTTIETHPWQVSIQSTDGFHFCGGSIIAPQWILTAQHCVEGSSANSMRVVAGTTRLSQAGSGQTRNVAQIIRFPGYSSPESGRDAALLRLSSALDLSGARARAIAINTDNALTNAGVNSIVTGWGDLREGGSSPDTLQAVTVPIVSNDDASDAYQQNITADQLAAGVLGVGGRDSCQGDSGGPLTVANSSGVRVLAGIVSWGNGCADPNFPGLYARVSSFATWINQNVSLNAAPTVSFTAPQANSTVSGNVTVSANATDSDGSIARVRFTFPDGSTQEDTSSPYSVVWDSRSSGDGNVTLRAVSIDNLGTSSSEASINVTAMNGNPTTCAPNGTFAGTSLPASIPDNNQNGLRAPIALSGNGNVATLRLTLAIRHTWRGDLTVNLISPRGTSFSVHNRTGGSADDLNVNNLNVAAFTGEPANGTWTLVVADREAQDTGTLQSWSLAVTADCGSGPVNPNPGNWSGTATPNIATRDNSSVCTSLTVSQSGDASAVRLDIAGRHDFRSILRGTLTHNGTTVEAFGVNVLPREAGNFSLTNRAVPGFSGDAAGEWTFCLFDTDAFNDTGTLNTWSVHN